MNSTDTFQIIILIITGVGVLANTAIWFIIRDLRDRTVRIEDWILRRANGGHNVGHK